MATTNATVENVTLDELKAGLADGSIVLVDVREPNEYAAGRKTALRRPSQARAGGAYARFRLQLWLHIRKPRRNCKAQHRLPPASRCSP